ncbi:MAG TPA: DUF4913 domain-containing protein [Glaciihabitans sp.]|nr:DUF4913 domain-containing protein [Glaciihabitans sp.]
MADELNEPDLLGLTDEEIDALKGRDLNDDDVDPLDVNQLFLDWVAQHFATVEVTGSNDAAKWCPEWWKHPEAVARLRAVWSARLQADAEMESETGDLAAVSSWWLNHWDRHAAILLDRSNGPFRDCDAHRGHLSGRDGKNAPLINVPMPSK